MDNAKKIVVVGLGYVGLPLALLAARKGYSVVGVDVDQVKIDLLRAGTSPFLEEMVSKYLSTTTMEFSMDFSCIDTAEIIIICVPTPVYENHMPNLELVISASRKVAEHLKKGQLVILESTVNPEVSEGIVLPILEEVSGLRRGDFSLAHAPERINPGDTKWNVENINRVVGALDSNGLEKAVSFYESILTGSVKRMGSLKEAEAVKVVENSFRDINIAFVNELARSFTRLGINVVNVIDGAATKPFAFMPHYPGCGVGGHCIPVDPYYLIEHAKKSGFDHDFLSLARRINNHMPHFTIERLEEGLNDVQQSLRGSTVTVLGVSYKSDIDDCRESPSFKIIKLLEEKGAIVRVFDPYVPRESNVSDIAAALHGACAVILATGHSLFKDIPAQVYAESGVKVMIDGRNVLSKQNFIDAGLIYKGIGN